MPQALRDRFKPCVTVVAVVVLLLFSTNTVSATHDNQNDYWHVHWERSSNPVTLDINLRMALWDENGEDYETPVGYALTNWASPTQDYVDFNEVTETGGDIEVFVFYVDYDERSGWVSCNPNCLSTSSTHLTWVDVVLNSHRIEYLIDNSIFPSAYRQYVAAHELGHSFGLAHSTVSPSTDAIMHYTWDGFETVKSRDVDVLGWSQLYGHTD
ncbi:MAG: hypothetical protein HW388_184 [Dehalococcoidia bacterium]|nr:hypothetical protein [Dehalococcoidia bacterium]